MMETWQFSLFFVALLLGIVVLHVRVARFEEYLRELQGLKSIDQRIQGVLAAMPQLDKQRLDRIESALHRLHEDLEDLRETTQQVEHAVVQIPAPVVAAPIAATAPVVSTEATSGERVLAMVETRLLQLGYHNLRILTDLRGAVLDGDLEVLVECERAYMPQKGRVLLRNGSIRDVALQTAAPMFP